MLIKHKIETVLKIHGADKDFASVYNSDVEQMLMLLKLLPLRLGGRSNVPNRANFTKAIEKLIVFAKVNKILLSLIYSTNHSHCIL